MKRRHVFVLFVWVCASAYAIPSLQTAFVAHYPSTRGTQLDSCSTCHMPSEASFLNAYGLHYRDANKDFEGIEPLDSDGDGVTNDDEIKALRFPGSQAATMEKFVFTNFVGNIPFDHEKHVVDAAYKSQGNCSHCHGDNAFAKKFDDNVSVKAIAHTVCIDCHKSSGSATAPTGCYDCHQDER